ncbi:MAG: hypothetical protein O3B68_00010 [Planctomycetota bacterium]|nr:hypothetical protein [Planctomycetota bacterium]
MQKSLVIIEASNQQAMIRLSEQQRFWLLGGSHCRGERTVCDKRKEAGQLLARPLWLFTDRSTNGRSIYFFVVAFAVALADFAAPVLALVDLLTVALAVLFAAAALVALAGLAALVLALVDLLTVALAVLFAAAALVALAGLAALVLALVDLLIVALAVLFAALAFVALAGVAAPALALVDLLAAGFAVAGFAVLLALVVAFRAVVLVAIIRWLLRDRSGHLI